MKNKNHANEKQSIKLNRRTFIKSTVATGAVVSSGVLGAPYINAGAKQKLVIQTRTGRITKLEQMRNSFIQKFPDADIEFIGLAGVDHEDTISKTLAQIAAGKQIDLQRVATEGIQLYAGAGYVSPLDKWVKRDAHLLHEYFDDVAPSIPHSMLYDGSLYQISTEWNAANIFINTKLFAENDIEYPGADWTKDDFYNIAKKITKKSGSKTDVFGYGWTNRLWGSWMPWIFNNDSNLYSEAESKNSNFSDWFWKTFYKGNSSVANFKGGPKWETPQANNDRIEEALEFMRQLVVEGISPATALGDGATLTGFFTTNKMGMTPAGGFWAGGLHAQGMDPDDFDVCFFPKWKSQRHQFGAGGYLMMDSCKHKDLAWEFIKHSSSYEWQIPFMAGNISSPARRSMHNALRYSYTGPKHWNVFYETLDKFPDTGAIPAPPCSNPMTRTFTKHTGLAMSGDLTPKVALKKMQRDLERITRKYQPMYKS
ncbi:MAG: extracellular solute-binding protein [Proteobacteria bacterium]|nr:MAG: extracellular solute-binding protein [Pseudomonadota bacterium]